MARIVASSNAVWTVVIRLRAPVDRAPRCSQVRAPAGPGLPTCGRSVVAPVAATGRAVRTYFMHKCEPGPPSFLVPVRPRFELRATP